MGEGVLLRFLDVLHSEGKQVLASSTFDSVADCVLWVGKGAEGGKEGGKGCVRRLVLSEAPGWLMGDRRRPAHKYTQAQLTDTFCFYRKQEMVARRARDRDKER